MKIVFIALTYSSNVISRSKLLNLSFLVKEDGSFTEFEGLVKPVPSLTAAEKLKIAMDYSRLRSASPLCDLVPRILPMLENAETVFLDRFSEQIFKKAFREIGLPMGSATYNMEIIFKNKLKSKTPFSLQNALELMDLEFAVEGNLQECKAMEKIFIKLEELDMLKKISSKTAPKERKGKNLSTANLPKSPGVYLFRDQEGTIHYVGKAKNISLRVRSHFTSDLSFEKELCSKTASIEFEETGSETIALLLESQYIQSLKPFYNTQQKDLIDPYTITSKIDSNGILRIQALQKSYLDSENEFYYNRDSVLNKIIEVQQKFNLCKRFTGIERTASNCSDKIFCKGICHQAEEIELYNLRVKNALRYIHEQRPSFIIRLKGKNAFESGFVLIEKGIYQGFGFIDSDIQVNSIEDIKGFTKSMPHTYFTSRIIDQHMRKEKKASENIIRI